MVGILETFAESSASSDTGHSKNDMFDLKEMWHNTNTET